MESNLLGMAWSQLWQVTLLVVVVAIPVRLAGGNRPHLAYALWLVVLVKCVTPPVWSSPSGVFCWLLPAKQVAIVESTVKPKPVRLAAPPDELIISLYPVESVPMPTVATAPTVETPRARFIWSDWAARGLLVWAVGASVSLGLSVWRWRTCLRKARRVPCEPVLELADRVSGLARRLGLRRRVRVFVTKGRLGPAVTGILRPTLLLPEGILTRNTPPELEPLLAHELIHIRRGDLWAGLLQTVVLALWWFHPLVRWAVREAMREAERCCDEAVVAELGCKPKDYARSLLGVLQYKMEWAPAPAFPGAGRIDATSKRLERIMRLRQGCRRRTPWWCWVVMFAVAVVVLPGRAFLAGDEPRNVHPTHAPGSSASMSVPVVPPSPQSPPVAASGEVRRSYDVEELVQTLTQSGQMDAALARELIIREANDLLSAEAGKRGESAVPAQCHGNSLLVQAPSEDQQSVARTLKAMRVYGVGQVTLSIRFVSATPETIAALGIGWNVMPEEEGDEENPLGPVPAWDPAAGLLALDRPLPDRQAEVRRGSVRHVTHTPMRYTVLDEDGAVSLIDRMQSDARTNLLQAPKVTMFNGQSAFVCDTSQSPFVVGVKPVESEGKTAHQPVVSIVEEGTRVRLRPVLRDDHKVWLDYEVIMTEIREVNSCRYASPGADGPLTVQLPVVETMQVDGANELPVGSTLVVAGLVKEEEPRVAAEKTMLTRLADSLFGDKPAAPERTELMLLIRVEQVVPAIVTERPDEGQVGMVSP